MVSNRVVVFGGYNATNTFAFDGTNWNAAAYMPASRLGMGAAVLNDLLYSVSGSLGEGAYKPEVYTFDGMNWSTNVPAFPEPRRFFASGTYQGQLYSAGGIGSSQQSNVYRYPLITSTDLGGVSPTSGGAAGGFQVTINGINLGNGTDITNVTLAGIAATNIASQSSTQVVVWAGPSGGAVQGDVVVYSASYGTSVRSNAFEYTLQLGPPQVGSPAATNIMATTATLGGTVTSTNGAPVTERGIVWSTSNGFDPVSTGTRVSESGIYGDGVFALSVTNLASGDTIYFMAYAVNSEGTNYTAQSNFQTFCLPPILQAATGITQTNFTMNWSPSTGAGVYRIDVSTNAAFSTYVGGYQDRGVWAMWGMSLTVTGLTDSTPYYYRIRAVGDAGASANSSTGMVITAAYSGGALAITPSSMVFSGTYGGSDPVGQTFVVTNFGETGCVVTNADSASWFSVAPSSASLTNGASLTVTGLVNLAGVNAGTYITTNRVDGGTNGVQSLVVTLSVAKAGQTISFAQIDPQQTTNTLALSATATSGGAVSFSLSQQSPATISGGTNLSFTGAGTVYIYAEQSGTANYHAAPRATNEFTVSKATAQVALTDLTQTYDGEAKSPTGLTSPTGLALSVIYNGSTNALATSGGSGTGSVSYAVLSGPGSIVGSTNLYATSGTGSIVVEATKAADAMYSAQSVTATVTVQKASQTISFSNPGTQFWTNTVAIPASSASGGSVTLTVVSGTNLVIRPISQISPMNLSFSGYGSVSIAASQAGDADWSAAPTVTNTFSVIGPQLAVLGTNGAVVASGAGVSPALGTHFGEALIGLETVTNTFTITNAGNALLTMETVETNGTHAGSFRLTGVPSSVAAGTTAVFSVVFDPQAGGTNDASVVFSFDGTNAPYTVNVAGVGLGGGIADATNAPQAYAVSLAVGKASQTITFPNPGLQIVTNTTPVAASASSGLSVALALVDGTNVVIGPIGPIGPISPINLTYARPGLVTLRATQAGNSDWTAASPVEITFRVRADRVPYADFDGDGRSDLSVLLPSLSRWYIQPSRSNNLMRVENWGWKTTVPVPGDYDGDGQVDVAAYAPGSAIWYILESTSNHMRRVKWGWGETEPVPGDYDGDGKVDIAVYSYDRGRWYIQQSASNRQMRVEDWGWDETLAPWPAWR